MYGAKWIGKWVTDCSGLFYWAFKELGGYMYHGSNTMWDKYCTAQGNLSSGARTDGQTLKPGTAVFTLKSGGNRSHVGLYIGNGKVIEASGT
jgi:cell wall-associated NlpC family hydrolase